MSASRLPRLVLLPTNHWAAISRPRERSGRQVGAIAAVGQLLLPMIAGIAHSKLLEWVHQVGPAALAELFEHDAGQLAGPKDKHRKARSHYRWGST